MRRFHSTKIILRFKNNAAGFISAYATHTPEAEQNAFVDIRGKIVAICDQFFIDQNEILEVIEAGAYSKLTKHLEKYLALSKTVIEQDTRRVFYDLDAAKPYLFFSDQDTPDTVTEIEFRA